MTNLGKCAIVDLPPSLDEIIGHTLTAVGPGREHNGVDIGYVLVLPRLDWANEVDDLCIPSKSVHIQQEGLMC